MVGFFVKRFEAYAAGFVATYTFLLQQRSQWNIRNELNKLWQDKLSTLLLR